MKRLLIALIVTLPLHCSLGQALSPYYQIKSAERVKQVLKDFESAFGLLTNPYITDRDERDEANDRMHASLRRDARFENDLIPDHKGTRTIDFDEYKRIAFVGYKKGGLSFHFDWEEAEFQSITNGYLVLFYGKKTLFGSYQSQKRLQLENVPCRAGVFLKMDGNQVAEARIGFMDTDLKKKSNTTISLTDQRNPLELVTLPEVIDKLARQIIHTLPEKETWKLFIEEITFDGLGISNDFSKQLTGTLKSSLARMSSHIRTDLTDSSGPLLKLKGRYYKSGNFLKIGVQLFDGLDHATGFVQSSEILLANVPNVEIEPAVKQVEDASRVQAIVQTGKADEPVAREDELLLEVSTDKGYGPQSYREGDVMTLKVRANKPCTVRMIYQDASKNLVQLRNKDFTITTDAVGKWIYMPEQFECAPPFGFEMLFAYATEGQFKPIGKTQSQNGFTFILDNLKNVVELTTGAGERQKIARCTIPITTQPRRKAP
ncbi:hypothetical protein [Dyadobacter sp. OTU695]|uniref:hypothetical protein n=1 Tax=Dyadobacter sp. OTU695 TaxID=3043860 RepID=UPI00313D760A